MPREKMVIVKTQDDEYILAVATGEIELTKDGEHMEVYNYKELYHSLQSLLRDV